MFIYTNGTVWDQNSFQMTTIIPQKTPFKSQKCKTSTKNAIAASEITNPNSNGRHGRDCIKYKHLK